MKVAIVAGEKSGDFLGSELIKALKLRYPDAEFRGLAGPLMQAEGARSLAEMEKISIFGLDGLFSALWEILAIRRRLYKHFIEWQPDLFVGIDVPDFNLRLERKLKDRGIPVVHYVSPTVWAWRGGRIKKIKRSIDLMLAMFPFEKTYYQKHQTPVEFVGHPFAQQIQNWQVPSAFAEEHVHAGKKLIAILPGSRMSEVGRLAPAMINGALALAQKDASLHFVIPAANDKIKAYLTDNFALEGTPIKIVDGHSRDVLALSHLVILASGTAALEAALFAKPMVVMYIIGKLSALIYKRSITVEHYSMPNHLTDPPAVPELIQEQATAENLIAEVEKLLHEPGYYQQMQSSLAQILPSLKVDSGSLACNAIVDMLKAHRR